MKVQKINDYSRVLTLESGGDVCIIANSLEKSILSKIKLLRYYLKKETELADDLTKKIKNLIQVLDDLLVGFNTVTDIDIKKLKRELEQVIAEGGVENG